MKNGLDQFYTNPLIAEELIKKMLIMFPNLKEYMFFEPSAGTGNFISALLNNGINKNNINAYDIDPKKTSSNPLKFTIFKKNYLTTNFAFSKNKVVIGNPPFGKRGSLAIEFLNKALTESPIVAFIMPNTLKRFSAQKQINKEAKLIYSKDLREESFIVDDKPYGVKCVFQIWVKNEFKTYAVDKRLTKQETITHPDFQTWIHNNTKSTLKFFNKKLYGWDIAVHRQGFYDYSQLIVNPDDLIKNRQYFFIKAKNKKVLNIIKKINFEKLSKSNTQTPGFSTTDFVKEYNNAIKNKIRKRIKNEIRKNI